MLNRSIPIIGSGLVIAGTLAAVIGVGNCAVYYGGPEVTGAYVAPLCATAGVIIGSMICIAMGTGLIVLGYRKGVLESKRSQS